IRRFTKPWGKRSTPCTDWPSMPSSVLNSDPAFRDLTPSPLQPGLKMSVSDLGRIGYIQALELQRNLVDRRKRGEIPDQLLFLEHPHVVTMGRNGHDDNLLAGPELLARSGIEFHR